MSERQSTDSSNAMNVSTMDMLQSAVRLHHQGKLEDAKVLYSKIVQVQSNHFEAHQLLATIALQKSYSRRGNGNQDNFSGAIGVSTIDMLQSAVRLHHQGQLREAEDIYKCILASEPYHPEAGKFLGEIALQRRRIIHSIELFDKEIAVQPGYLEAGFVRENLLKTWGEDKGEVSFSRKNERTVAQKRTLFDRQQILSIRGAIFLLATLFCFTPFASPPLALLIGLIVAQFIGQPFPFLNSKVTSLLLKVSVVGLGFGINFSSAVHAGSDGLLFTFFSIFITLMIGGIAGKLFMVDKKTSFLISAGTAICGGSAIAAVATVIDAEEKQVSVALGTVFILNLVALFLFPEVGRLLQMTQHQFGLWAAIAIHDTSSVVGAAGKYGHEALLEATTVKLARTLWIIPVTIVSSIIFKQKIHDIKAPWFIAFFVGATILHTYLPQLQPFTRHIVPAAKTGLTVTLFLIGTGLSWKVLKSVGWPPLVQGIITWLAISIITLFMVLGVS